MSEINAYRMDGLGNDFIIVDRRENSINLSKEKIIKLGDRKVLGFDQILFIEKLESDSYPIKIYNSDCGEVSACGNGARCVAYLLGKNLNIKEIKLKTNNRLLSAKIVGDFDVELEMGKPLFNFEEIPLSILNQLKNGGRIGAVFIEEGLGTARIGYKLNSNITWRYSFNAAVPVLEGFLKQKDFVL